MRKHSWGSGLNWLLVGLCLIIVFSPMVLMARPTYAQSPYEESLAQLQSIRESLATELAVYQSADADTRVMMDATLASGVQQALQQIYWSMSASDRAKLDEETRQWMGYSFLQLMQMSSTIPGMVRTVDVLTAGLQNLYGDTNLPPTPTPAPTPTPTPTPTPAPTPTPTPAPTPGEGVDVGSGELKLGWVLYGRTDLSDEAAQAIYDGKVKERVAALDLAIAAATERLEKYELQLDMESNFDLLSVLSEDLKDAKERCSEAGRELSFDIFKAGAMFIAGKEGGKILNVLWQGKSSYDITTLAQEPEPTQKQIEDAGKGFVSIVGTVADLEGIPFVGKAACVVELGYDLVALSGAYGRVTAVESVIAERDAPSIEKENRSRLQQQIQMEKDTLEALQSERERLTTTSYLDLR